MIIFILSGFVIICTLAYVMLRCMLNKPIVADLNSPKYKSMKDYDSYEEWKKDWC